MFESAEIGHRVDKATYREWMDPRYISTLAFSESSDEERERPAMWRYWR